MACLFLNICNFFQALSGVGATIEDRADISDNDALSAALNAQFLFQIGVFTAVPMILGFILEQGFLRVCFLGPSHSLICYAKEVLFFYQTWLTNNWAITWIAYKILIERPMSMFFLSLRNDAYIFAFWASSQSFGNNFSVFCIYFTFLALDL